jgi:hypothetical protein
LSDRRKIILISIKHTESLENSDMCAYSEPQMFEMLLASCIVTAYIRLIKMFISHKKCNLAVTKDARIAFHIAKITQS